MTQRLLAVIVTALGGKQLGQAMGLNVFALFTGFGVGSLLFGEALRLGSVKAPAIFGAPARRRHCGRSTLPERDNGGWIEAVMAVGDSKYYRRRLKRRRHPPCSAH